MTPTLDGPVRDHERTLHWMPPGGAWDGRKLTRLSHLHRWHGERLCGGRTDARPLAGVPLVGCRDGKTEARIVPADACLSCVVKLHALLTAEGGAS